MRRVLVVLVILGGLSSSCAVNAQQNTTPSLEVTLANPLRWESGCLRGTLNISNRSTVPLFLTMMGPYYDIALNVSKGETQSDGPVEWVNVAGVSDVVINAVEPLSAGSTVQRNFCLEPSVWVVNLRLKTRREIPVRGELRVRVTYFVNKESWNRNRQWYSDPPSALDPSKPHDVPENIQPRVAETIVEIPCRTEACKSDCTKPPKGLPDEARMVPDVSFIDPQMSARGKLLTEEFARKFPACSEAEHQPQ
jgi:hypothetical protein